jgi:hypothetical protein
MRCQYVSTMKLTIDSVRTDEDVISRAARVVASTGHHRNKVSRSLPTGAGAVLVKGL